MSLNNGHISDISVPFRTYIGHFYRWLSVPACSISHEQGPEGGWIQFNTNREFVEVCR